MNDKLVTFIASFLIWILFGVVFSLWLFTKKLTTREFLSIVLSVFVSLIIATIIKNIFDTQRPFVVMELDHLTFTHPKDSSFPSAHSAAVSALVASAYWVNKRLALVLFGPAAFVALGRVLARVHYPVDIVAGIIVGIIGAWLVNKVQKLTLDN